MLSKNVIKHYDIVILARNLIVTVYYTTKLIVCEETPSVYSIRFSRAVVYVQEAVGSRCWCSLLSGHYCPKILSQSTCFPCPSRVTFKLCSVQEPPTLKILLRHVLCRFYVEMFFNKLILAVQSYDLFELHVLLMILIEPITVHVYQ